ncbi:MAG TPA: ATP synthase F0 subunit B [Bryobacteraceae bacterium]|jgi:F-type H+-transporting ATPase subunit b
MEQTLQALGGILIKAIPTVIALVFLHFFFRVMLFGPLRKTLKQREELTAGARRAAEASQAAAESKAAEYEIQFRDARAAVYKEQEEIRRQWLADQAAQLAEARSKAEATVKQAKFEVASEAAAARQNLLETSAGLADQIATAVLSRRPTPQ